MHSVLVTRFDNICNNFIRLTLAELRAAPGRQVGGLQPSRNEGWQGGAHHTYAKPRVIERSYEVFAELRDAPRPLHRLGSVLGIIQRLPELPGTQFSACRLLLVAAAAIFTLVGPDTIFEF